MSVSLGGTQRREGFEILRDVVTRHRRAWAAQHLDGYLRHRWDSELRQVSREYSRRIAAAGKPPTPRQFASFAASVANHWFGGDLAALYAALGEQSLVDPRASICFLVTRWSSSAPSTQRSGEGRPCRQRLPGKTMTPSSSSGSFAYWQARHSVTCNSTKHSTDHRPRRSSAPSASAGISSAVAKPAGLATRLQSRPAVPSLCLRNHRISRPGRQLSRLRRRPHGLQHHRSPTIDTSNAGEGGLIDCEDANS